MLIEAMPRGTVVRIGEDIMTPPLLIGRYGYVTSPDVKQPKRPGPSALRIVIGTWPQPSADVWVPAHWLTRLSPEASARFLYTMETAQHQGDLKQARDHLETFWDQLMRLFYKAGAPLDPEDALQLDAAKLVSLASVRSRFSDETRAAIYRVWEQIIQSETRYRALTEQLIED